MISAAVWRLTTGKWMRGKKGLQLSRVMLLGEEVDNCNEPDELSNERWLLWQGKLGEMAGRSDFKKKTRTWGLLLPKNLWLD